MPKMTLPYMPDVIDLRHLKNGRLLPAEKMLKIREMVDKGILPPGKISKKELEKIGIKSDFSVLISKEGKSFVVYHGEQQGSLLGKGGKGKAKLGQDEDGKFVAIKFIGKSKSSLQKQIQQLEQQIQDAKEPIKELAKEVETKKEQKIQATLQKNQEAIKALTDEVTALEVKIYEVDLDNDISLKVKHLEKKVEDLKAKLNTSSISESEISTLSKAEQLITTIDNAIVMKMAEGDELQIANLYYNFPIIDRMNAALIFCGGLGKLHDLGVLHNDLKAENTKINASSTVSIIDFGESVLKSENSKALIRGSPANMAPEMFAAFADTFNKGNQKVVPPASSEAMDIYCAGIWIANQFNLITAKQYKLPNKANFNVRTVVDEKSNAFVLFAKKIGNEGIAKTILSMLKQMTSENPEQRPPMKDIENFFLECMENSSKLQMSKSDVAVVNLDEFLALPDENKKVIIDAAKEFGQVQFIGSNLILKDVDKVLLARKMFDDELIRVRQDVYPVDEIIQIEKDDKFKIMALKYLTLNTELKNDAVSIQLLKPSTSKPKPKIETIELQIIPKKMDISDLKEHGQLTKKQLNQLKIYCKEKKGNFIFGKDGAGYRLNKKELRENGIMSNYSIDVSKNSEGL